MCTSKMESESSGHAEGSPVEIVNSDGDWHPAMVAAKTKHAMALMMGTKLPRHVLSSGLKGEEFVAQPGSFHEFHGFGGAMHVLFCLVDEGIELEG